VLGDKLARLAAFIEDFFAGSGVTADPELPSIVPVARDDGGAFRLDGAIGLSGFLRMGSPFGELRECRRRVEPRSGEAQLIALAVLFVAAFFVRGDARKVCRRIDDRLAIPISRLDCRPVLFCEIDVSAGFNVPR
jgi:hypothetical protein